MRIITRDTTDGYALRQCANLCLMAQYAKANGHLYLVRQYKMDAVLVGDVHRLGLPLLRSRIGLFLCGTRV